MEIKASDYNSNKFDPCGNTTVAEMQYNGMRIPLCSQCLASLRESLKIYDDTIFCHKCANFIMSKDGWDYGGSCLKSLDDKTKFDPKDAGYINCKDCMDTCDDAISKIKSEFNL